MSKFLFALPLLFLAAASASAAGPAKEPGAMLREGTWTGGVGTYNTPLAFEGLPPSKWPLEGWYRLTFGVSGLQSVRVVAPAKQSPDFLRSILPQIELSLTPTGAEESAPVELSEAAANNFYLRVPGIKLREGALPVYVFKNGTPAILPELDRRYDLVLGTVPFSFSVRNGLRGKNGAPYGEGAHYTIDYGGHTYTYDLGGYGWDSSVRAITDLDGDGKPDFLINVGVSNGGYEAWLLSSTAKPGKNVPTASLSSTGC